MRTSITLLFCAISLSSFSQRPVATLNQSRLMKVWVMEDGNFPHDVIKFRSYDPQKDSIDFYTSYEFNTGGVINYNFHVPRGKGVCGNGLQYLSVTKWTAKGNTVRVYLKGGYFVAGTFEYDIVYRIEKISDNQLILKRKKTYKNKMCYTCFN